jgi:hypothetical protein
MKRVKNVIKEKKYLHISSNKAQMTIPWRAKLDLKIALKLTINFYLLNRNKIYDEAIGQIRNYFLRKNKDT